MPLPGNSSAPQLAPHPVAGVAKRIALKCSPEQVFAGWPRDVPLAAIWSAGGGPHARWTVLAQPASVARAVPHENTVVTTLKALLEVALDTATTEFTGPDAPPFQGGIIGVLEYELGSVLEPAVLRGGKGSLPGPGATVEVHRCDDALMFDHLRGQWWAVGNPPIPEGGEVSQEIHEGGAGFEVGPLASRWSPAEYVNAVRQALDYIHAGDVYQVNVAHRLSAAFSGNPRAFFMALASSAQPWHGAYVETADRVVASASPELFMSFDPESRALTTRPMKGTRKAGAEADLHDSGKDRAELNMITDLMRNDVGKVSELGTVRVEQERSMERHGAGDGALVQTTATVRGRLRDGLTAVDALASMFPAGSITGCPKVRAMQIIRELEVVERAVYCGSIGFVSRSGHAAFNVAIRTATLVPAAGSKPSQGGHEPTVWDTSTSATLRYSVGAGIVAESDPQAEWQETLDKAAVLRRAVGQ